MKREFSRKPYDKFLYKWSPDEIITKQPDNEPPTPYFCNALPRSQGEDWITTYVYQSVNDNGSLKRIAYVACDYVQ